MISKINKAMILAAGRGERMRPLTDTCPKPLLKVNNVPLIDYHLNNLVRAGINDIVINHAWLGQQIVEHLGTGRRFGANIVFSAEQTALETAGGIKKALPQLVTDDDDIFLVVNGDIFCDYDFSQLPLLAATDEAHLILVDNPSHHPQGDFSLQGGRLTNPSSDNTQACYTFSGIALYRAKFFETLLSHAADNAKLAATNTVTVNNEPSEEPLAPLLRAGADRGVISASLHLGHWTDVGTPKRLAQLNNEQ